MLFRNTHPVRRYLCLLLGVALLLCGCARDGSAPKTEANDPPGTTTPTPPQDPLAAVKSWLEADFSFDISSEYMELAVFGISQKINQTSAADGSWSFFLQRKVWDHTLDYEQQTLAEYYYRYEDTKLVCYSKIDDGQPQRMELSDRERKELEKSKGDMVGVPGLLPDYLQDMSVSQTEDAAVFTFLLPVEDVLAETTILSVYIHNAMTLSYRDSLPENLMVVCTLEADPQTFQPRSLSYDFSQLKPYVLSEGTLSGEYALDTDCMTLVYTFDYNLSETTTIPKSMLPEEA